MELGAGTGQFTLAVAPFCAQVVAANVSPVMLRQLRSKIRDAKSTNVTVVEGGFLSYQHRGPQADFVYSRYALHHLPDFWKAVALLHRVAMLLQPGGVLRLWDVVYNFDPADPEDRIEAWCASAGSAVDDEWSRDEYGEHVREEHSTFT